MFRNVNQPYRQQIVHFDKNGNRDKTINEHYHLNGQYRQSAHPTPVSYRIILDYLRSKCKHDVGRKLVHDICYSQTNAHSRIHHHTEEKIHHKIGTLLLENAAHIAIQVPAGEREKRFQD